MISAWPNKKLLFLNLEISRLGVGEVAQLVRALAAQTLGSVLESPASVSEACIPELREGGDEDR